MKILVSVEHLYPGFGGAEVYLDKFLRRLAEKHTIQVIESEGLPQASPGSRITVETPSIPLPFRLLWYKYHSSPRWKYQFSPIMLQSICWRGIVEKKIREYAPDLLLTQQNLSAASIDAARRNNVPSVMLIHDFRNFSYSSFDTRGNLVPK